MPNRVRVLVCSAIGAAWYALSLNLKLFLEVLDLLNLTFEVVRFEMAKNKVEDRKP